MNNVVYVLGAGFSAPMGLSVTSNFLFRAREIYFQERTRFAGFSEVLASISLMSRIKNFYGSDLYNIEEILSVFEMAQNMDEGSSRTDFIKFICDVIIFLTPPINAPNSLPGNWQDHLCEDNEWCQYAAFLACILRLEILDKMPGQHSLAPQNRFQSNQYQSDTGYSIVTLNYDLIVEKFVEYLCAHWNFPLRIQQNSEAESALRLAKLHGSVETGTIVPPTWNKSLRRNIMPAWRQAMTMLAEANHIRIIGYSLPAADAYVRYLFKAAALGSENLKSFDVVCLDPDKSVEARYRDFVTFPRFRFANAKTEDYLQAVTDSMLFRANDRSAQFNTLERSHDAFFERVVQAKT